MDDCFSSESFRLKLLKTNVPMIIILFFKSFLLQDVSGVILQYWWELFSCEYIHKYCTKFIFASRHVIDGLKDPVDIELFRCLRCGEVQYMCNKPNWYKYTHTHPLFPSCSPWAWMDYHVYIAENIRRNPILFKDCKYKFIKKFSMQEFQKLLGTKPFAWNEQEALLLPYYMAIITKQDDEEDLQVAIKRKREDICCLFMNKKQRIA